VRKSSDCKKRFVIAHSQRKPLSVLGDIGSQARVVLKHFTPSTFEPWKGAVVSTFVDTYSQGVWIDCPVTSSNCCHQMYIPFTQSPVYADQRMDVAVPMKSSVNLPLITAPIATHDTLIRYHPFPTFAIDQVIAHEVAVIVPV